MNRRIEDTQGLNGGDYPVIATRLDAAINWIRKNSCWPQPMGLACCAMEVESAARLGLLRAEVGDGEGAARTFLLVAGTVTDVLAPAVHAILATLPPDTLVVSFGACAGTGGPYWDAPTVTKGVDQLVPVAQYIPGCPPRPEALLHALITLQEQIDNQKLGRLRWYGKGDKPQMQDFPVPTFGAQGLEVDGKLVDPVGGLPSVSPYTSPEYGEQKSGQIEHPEITRHFPIMDPTVALEHALKARGISPEIAANDLKRDEVSNA